MCSGTGNDHYTLVESELAGFVQTTIVLVFDAACIPSRFNVGGVLRPYKIEELPLKDASECGLAPDFSRYFGIGDSVMAQQVYTTAPHCIRSIRVGIGN